MASALEMLCDATGTASDVENPASDEPHGRPFKCSPTAELREVRGDIEVRFEETIVAFKDHAVHGSAHVVIE